jgi:hypothetical protein
MRGSVLARIEQRIEILKAADWLIRLLESPEIDARSAERTLSES